MMDLTSLGQFLVVARREHLSGAAEELQISQPALSRSMARLESELGVRLFDRGGRLRLNDTGRLFRDHVERALGELDAGRRAVAEAAGQGVGRVRLASETFLTLTGPLAAYKRDHPSVDIELQWSPSDDMARRLRAQESDLCVSSEPVRADGVESVDLFEDPVGLGTPVDHPLAARGTVGIDDLVDQPLITARPGHWIRRLLDRLFAARGLTPKIICESDEPSAIAGLISAGLGVGLIPAFALRGAPAGSGVWLPVDDPDCRRTVSLSWNADSRLPTAARLLRTTITSWDWTPPAGW
ncbi:MAG: LysR family transcriptional regulator [Microlunatus sp.]|nr:LysR family transcriptional regulator [Microlunatus sp.]